MQSIADVLDKDEESEGEYGSETDEYGTHVDELASALGIDRSKAERVAGAICALARYEMEAGGAEPEPERGHKGKPSIAVVLGGK